MSVEIKCDRCGKPVPAEGVRYNIIVTKNGRGEIHDLWIHDLCDDCLQKLDIFMSGKMPAPEYKSDKLVYLELPDPAIYAREKEQLAGLKRVSEIHISGDLEPLNKLIEGHGYAYLPLSAVKQVILGVNLL